MKQTPHSLSFLLSVETLVRDKDSINNKKLPRLKDRGAHGSDFAESYNVFMTSQV